jgi:hypothetical protein
MFTELSEVMSIPRYLQLAAVAACTLAALPAYAGGDDPISTDRPDVVESSQVVGKGRVQIETSIQWERQRGDVQRIETLSTPTLLRVGAGERFELRVETDGRMRIRSGDSSGGERVAGYADSAFGIKWHVQDQEGEGLGSRPSMAWLAHADLPSGSRVLRGHGVRPSLRLAVEWELADGFSFGVMPGLAVDTDEAGKRYRSGILAATLGKALSERVRGFVELAAPQIARAAHGGTEATFDAGLTYSINKDCQLDVALARGLNRRSPDLRLGAGLSVRM